MTSLTYNCYSQVDQFDISGSWKATKGELITSLCNGDYEIMGIDISELRFAFNTKTVKINRTFDHYSADSIYNYAFMDTTPTNHRYWNKIRIKFKDKNTMIIEMHFLGYYNADRVRWYDIYLKKE
jgi:hypothetical protein